MDCASVLAVKTTLRLLRRAETELWLDPCHTRKREGQIIVSASSSSKSHNTTVAAVDLPEIPGDDCVTETVRLIPFLNVAPPLDPFEDIPSIQTLQLQRSTHQDQQFVSRSQVSGPSSIIYYQFLYLSPALVGIRLFRLYDRRMDLSIRRESILISLIHLPIKCPRTLVSFQLGQPTGEAGRREGQSRAQ